MAEAGAFLFGAGIGLLTGLVLGMLIVRGLCEGCNKQ